jgi:hypothetical protein
MLLLLADHAAMAIHNAGLHAAAESERSRLRILVETSPVGVLIVDKGPGGSRFVNKEAARLLGGRFTADGEALSATGPTRSATGPRMSSVTSPLTVPSNMGSASTQRNSSSS